MNEESYSRIQDAIGVHDDLLTMVNCEEVENLMVRPHLKILWHGKDYYCPLLSIIAILKVGWTINEPPRDKTNKMIVCQAKTQINLGIHSVWSVCAVRSVGS